MIAIFATNFDYLDVLSIGTRSVVNPPNLSRSPLNVILIAYFFRLEGSFALLDD